MAPNLKIKTDESLHQKVYFFAAILVALIATKYIASALIAPILISAMFAVLMLPIFYMYKKRGLSSSKSLLLMVLTILFSVVGLFYVLGYAFSLIQESIGAAVENFKANLNIESLGIPGTTEIVSAAESAVTPQAVLDILNAITSNFSSLFLYFIVIPVLAVLLVSQIDSFSDQFKNELAKSGPSLSKYRKFAESVNSYIIGRFKVNLATASLVTLALVIMGIDYPLLWGALTLILCFIPYLGIFIAGAGPFMIALGTGGMASALILVVVYIIITTITENIIDPMVQGSQNRLTTASMIIGVIFWSWMFGILGTIIAAPMTFMLCVLLEDYDETRWIAMLMRGDYSKTPTDSKSFVKSITGLKKKIPGI